MNQSNYAIATFSLEMIQITLNSFIIQQIFTERLLCFRNTRMKTHEAYSLVAIFMTQLKKRRLFDFNTKVFKDIIK